MPARLDIAALLGRLPLFSGLAPTELEHIAQGSRACTVARGELIFHKGDPCLGLYVVIYGQVKLALTSPQGHEKVVEIIRPGQSFGEAVMFMDKPYPVHAQALVDCELLHVAKSAIFAEMARDPQLCCKMIASLSSRLHHLLADVESYSLYSGKQRIIGYLLREAPEPPPGGNGVTVELPTRKGTIASRLNLTQEHFSRILHELAAAGLIRVTGRQIEIPDLERLRRFD